MRPSATPRSRPKRGSYVRGLFGLVGTVALLYFGKSFIVPLALAVLLTFILTPLVVAVQRRGLSRVPAVLLVVSFTFVVSGAVGWGVGSQVGKLVNDLPRHADEIKAKTASLRGSGTGPFSRLLDLFHEVSQAPPAPGGTVSEKSVVVARVEGPSSFDQLLAVGEAVLEPIANAGLILILVIFMLIKREDLRNRVIGLLGHGRLTGTTRVLVEAAQRLSRFLLMQLCVNSAFGLVFGLALWVIGVPYWFLWGFLTALLRFIPYVGTWMAAALPVILSFAVSPGWSQPIIVLIVFMVLDLGTANVIEPLLFGHSTGVSAVALLVAAAFWTWVWGPIGLVLSTPMTVCLVVLGQHVPRLKFLSLLLGDQPALPAPVSYYQRLLAGDRDEAAGVLQEYATTNGVDHIGDDVLLPALRLARRDRKRAGLTAEDENFIYDSTKEVLERLDKQRQSAPSPKSEVASIALTSEPEARSVIMACPAHHKVEELTLHVFAELMRPAGCQVEVLSTKTLPSDVEMRIAREKPAVVFIAAFPQGLVQARYLCKRLRGRFPELKIVVGFWGRTRNFDKLLVRLRTAGASYVTTSLLQSRTQVRALLGLASEAVPAPLPGIASISPAGQSAGSSAIITS